MVIADKYFFKSQHSLITEEHRSTAEHSGRLAWNRYCSGLMLIGGKKPRTVQKQYEVLVRGIACSLLLLDYQAVSSWTFTCVSFKAVLRGRMVFHGMFSEHAQKSWQLFQAMEGVLYGIETRLEVC
jgi:hypothetical protein